jgi:hypothetical protein
LRDIRVVRAGAGWLLINRSTDMGPETAEDMEELELVNLPEEEEEDEDIDDEDDDDDEDLDDDEDEDEDDDVGTDGGRKEILRADDSRQAPDVASDRVPATDAEPEGSLDRVKSGPLGIQQIEDLEDDAKGG